MTNVPGAEFAALLAIAATLLVLPLLAGVSLLVATVTRRRLEWTLLGVHVAAIVCGLIALVVGSPAGLQIPSAASVGSLLVFSLSVVAAGLLVAGVAEGVPVLLGAILLVGILRSPWDRGLWYATLGYAVGGIGGSIAGMALTGSVMAAAVGALLAAPAALAAIVFERAATRLDRSMSAS